MPNNQALFQELTDYTKSYEDLEKNIQVEVIKLEYQNEKLQVENNLLHNLLHNILQTLKNSFINYLNRY